MLDKVLKGTVLNQPLSSLHGGSLEITLTLSLRAEHPLRFCRMYHENQKTRYLLKQFNIKKSNEH